ncbi:PAAR domain-containing protein [Pseudomonas nicosulfuronedens]
MARWPIIIVGDVTDHGGEVLTGSSGHTAGGRSIARVGDTVSCPTHGNNPIIGGGTTILIDGNMLATAGMSTQCGSHLIASQYMFNTLESRQERDGAYRNPLWNQVNPGNQPLYNPHGASLSPGDFLLSATPPEGPPTPLLPPSE